MEILEAAFSDLISLVIYRFMLSNRIAEISRTMLGKAQRGEKESQAERDEARWVFDELERVAEILRTRFNYINDEFEKKFAEKCSDSLKELYDEFINLYNPRR